MPELEEISRFRRPTALGAAFDVISFKWGDAVLVALARGELATDGLLVRVHSPCLFGESFGVNSCDCGEQLQMALAMGAEAQDFLLVYLADQEGRGHGMEVKIRAIELEANQDLEMPEAFHRLGLPLDLRDYAAAAAIIRHLVGDRPIRLLTNNPKKLDGLAAHGVTAQRVALVVENPTAECRRYLSSKRREMGHLLPNYD